MTPTANDVKRVTFDVSENTHKAIRVKAAELGIPIAVIMRGLVEKWLKGEVGFEPEK